MSTIEATIRTFMTFKEIFGEADMPAVANRTLTNDQFNASKKLTATTTPPASKGWAGEMTGSQTLDLTALTRLVGPTVNATGLKLQAMLVNNLSTTATLSLAKGASNGYAVNGASGNLVVPPGGSVQIFYNESLADVAAGAKTIDCTVTPAGSGVENEDFQVVAIFG